MDINFSEAQQQAVRHTVGPSKKIDDMDINFSEAQQQAVRHTVGPFMCLAGPGSG